MGYYKVDHNGSAIIDRGKEKEPMKKIRFKEDEPIEDVKKGDLDHVPGAEYHTGKPDEKEDSDEKE